MKKYLFFAIAFLCFSSFLWGSHRIAMFQQKIHTLLHAKVVKELNLQGQKKEDVLKVLTEFDDKKVTILDELLHLRETLKEKESNKSISETELADLIEKIKSVSLKIQLMDQDKRAALRKVLSPEEVAKYLVIEHQVMDKIRTEVRNELKKPKSNRINP